MDSTQAMKMNLEREFQSLIKSANSLVNAASSVLDSSAQEARHMAQEVSEEGMSTLWQQYDRIEDSMKSGLTRAGRLIREHPYWAVGTTVALGLAISFLVRER